MPNNYSPQDILALSLDKNDVDAPTFGAYLAELTAKVLYEQEDFSGKRPFGNSDWLSNLIHPLILNKVIDGELDEYGFVEDYNSKQFFEVIKQVTDLLRYADYSTLQLPPEPKEYFVVAFNSDGEMSGYIEFPHTKEDAEKQLASLGEGYNPSYWRVIHVPSVA